MDSDFLSKISSCWRRKLFFFLFCPTWFFAHPRRYLRTVLILFCHLCNGYVPLFSAFHTFVIKSKKSSLASHPNSNLKRGVLPLWDAWFVSNKSGVWSEISLVKASTVDKGNFYSQSVLTRILSSLSKVGCSAEFAQVNFRPSSSSSLKFKVSIPALKSNGHLLL